MATFESLVKLKQLYETDISGYILQVVSGMLATGVPFNTGNLNGVFYPYSGNPANYITSGQTGQFATQSNLNSTGSYLIAYIGATAYPNTNPNGYISSTAALTGVLTTGMNLKSGINWTDYFTNGTILSFIPNQSLEIAGPNSVIQFYNTSANADGNRPYISGYDIWAYNVNCTGINNLPILTSGYVVANFVPTSKFTKGQAGQGFNYFLLTDTTESTQTLFDAGNNYYLQGRNQVNVSWPYIIDMYGTQAPTYGYSSGAPFILGFDLYSNNIEQQGYRVLTTNDLSASGIVLSGSFLAMSGYFQANENRLNTLLNDYMESGISGAYPLVGNPSGFVTLAQVETLTGGFIPSDNTIFVTSGELLITGAQYPNGFFDVNLEQQWVLLGDFDGSVNNTFINLGDWDKTITFNAQNGCIFSNPSLTVNGHQVVTVNQTGNFVTTNQTGQFYSASNPSNFIPLSQVGGVRQIYVTGTPISGNVGFAAVGGCSVFLSGNYVVISGGAGGGGTGVATGAYVDLVSHQFISGLKDFTSGIAVSTISGDANYGGMIDADGVSSVDWNGRTLDDTSAQSSVAWGSRFLVDTGGNNTVDWQNQQLLFESQPGIDWLHGFIYDNNIVEGGVKSIDYFDRWLMASVGGESTVSYPTIDWQNQILTGAGWTINSGNFISGLTIKGIPVSTGNVNTGSLTGIFYPYSSNPMGYLTSGQTGTYIYTLPINSGVSQQFITFPYSLGTNPSVLCNLNNLSGNENIFAQISGITSTGFWATFSQIIDSSGYSLTTIASLGSQTGFATTVILNSGSNLVGYSPSLNYNTGIDWSLGTSFRTTLVGNATMTFANSSDGMSINVLVRNTGNAAYTVTWPSTIRWPNAYIPVQSTGSATDIYTFVNFTGVVYGSFVQNF